LRACTGACFKISPLFIAWCIDLQLTHELLIRSHVATEADVVEAVNLFKVSTVEAAQSGINQQVTLTPEIKVCRCHCYYLLCFLSVMSFSTTCSEFYWLVIYQSPA